jgi:predicted nuclease of predicted toxin-antitoxin system
VRLLLDEMWPPSVAEQLRGRGHDVVAVAERPELRTQPDEVIFAAAQGEERAIVTEDPGFRRLAAETLRSARPHPGLILTSDRSYARSDPRTYGRLVSALHALLVSEVDLRDREHWLD